MTTPTKTLLIDNEFARVTLWRCNCTLTERKKPYAFYLSPCQSKAPICARDAEVPWPRKPADPNPRYQRHCANCWWTGEIHETGTYFEPGTDLDDDFRPDGEDVCPRCRCTAFMGPGTVKVDLYGVPMWSMSPVAAEPAPEPSAPDPDEVRRAIREAPNWFSGPISAAAAAWLRSREQQAVQQPIDWPLPSFDAQDWAREFMRLFGGRRDEIDEGLMIGWFANALMRGFDEHQRRADERREQQAEAAIDRLVESKWRQMQPSRERRERIATAVLGGMAANMNREQFTEAVLRLGDSHSRGAAETAIIWADALIAALDKEA